MFGKIFGYDSSESKNKDKKRQMFSKVSSFFSELFRDFLESDFFAQLLGWTMIALFYGCLIVVANYCSDSKPKKQKVVRKPHDNAIPFVGEPDFEEVVQELEANEEMYIGLFPKFDRSKDIIKLCYVNNYDKDVYYLKDGKDIKYRIGYGYNLGFHLDSMRIDNKTIIKYTDCKKLNL